jgi:tartrate dehydrogenase/decarboxylase/D-malate dehydrogenase
VDCTPLLFRDEEVEHVAPGFPDVAVERAHVDALAARMVLEPHLLDVIVASNLFGDIVGDLAVAIVGGLGNAASGNIGPARTRPPMFESVRGAAPDITGRGITNPVARGPAGVMMLVHLGLADAGGAVRRAVDQALRETRRHPGPRRRRRPGRVPHSRRRPVPRNRGKHLLTAKVLTVNNPFLG